MDGWVWLVFTLAVPLATSTAGAQTTTSNTPAVLPTTTAVPDHSTTDQTSTTGQNINTVTPQDTTLTPTMPTPESTLLTTTTTPTTSLSATTLTTVHGDTNTTQKGSNLTTVHEGTSTTPESTLLTTTTTPTTSLSATTLTTVHGDTNTTQKGSNLTTVHEGTSTTPESTLLTTTSNGTSVSPTTRRIGATTPDFTTTSPRGTTLTTISDGTSVSPGSTTVTLEGTTNMITVINDTTLTSSSNSSTTHQSIPSNTESKNTTTTASITSEYPETSPAPGTSRFVTTTDLTSSTTNTFITRITDTTFYTTTDQMTTTTIDTTTTYPYTTIALPLTTNTAVTNTTVKPTTERTTTTYNTPIATTTTTPYTTSTTIDTTTAHPYTNTTLASTTNTAETNTAFHSTTRNHTLTTTTQTINTTTMATNITHSTTTTTTRTTPSTTTTTTTRTTPSTTTTTTKSTTTITPPTTTALKCSNGGENVNGVCICPDDWTGETCSVENFCEAKQLDGFRFPRTPIGWFAYSEQLCNVGTSGAGKPRASTRCLSISKPPTFTRPEVFQCDQTLSDIQQNLTHVADLEILATSTQILTSKPEELTAENVTAAAQIVNTLLLSPNATESVRVAAVATVSQLLNATVPDNTEETTTTLGLTVTLDQLSLNLSHNVSVSQVVQPNLVVQSAQIPVADNQGVQFTSLRGTSGSFVADRVQLNTNTTQVEVKNGFIADALIYIQFPPGEGVRRRQTKSNVSLGFVLYQNDRFFRSKLYMRRRATVRVLSASVRGQERNVVPQHVELLFRPTLKKGMSLYDFSCVFWDYSLQEWSTDGCFKGNASDGIIRCFCNHTTNFAALWSYRENYEYAEALGVVSIVGLSLSILGLVVTIVHHIMENFHRKSRERHTNLNSKLVLLWIYLSLLIFIITFLSGVQNSSRQNHAEVQTDSETNHILDSDERVEPDRGSCTAVAALLHFFLLATFTWNGVYSTQLVLMVHSLRRSLPPHWTPLSLALGWGVPAVFMAVTLGVTYRVDDPLRYRQEEFCWLAAVDGNKEFSFGKPMFWGFLVPVGLILIYNVVLLVLISMTTCKVDPKLTSTKQSSSWKKFLISFSLAVLLGLSWTLGYLVLLSSGTMHLVFSILFCICTTTQGLQIFILFTARTPTFRATMSRSYNYMSSLNIPLKTTKYRLWKNWNNSHTETYRDLRDGETTTSQTL